jgi:hypothetical protein
MSTSAVNDTTHTVHRPGVLRSMSSLELKEHHVAEALAEPSVIMGQFRTRSMSTSIIGDMDGSAEHMPGSTRRFNDAAAPILPDKVTAGL